MANESMARTSGMGDLFGHVAQRGELPIEARPQPRDEIIGGLMPVPPGGHTPESVRAQVAAVLEEARAANVMPWPPRLVRRYTALFPYWAEWLKGGEGDQLLLDFKAEMDRLEAPADQVAPNWRKMWGLAA